MIAIYKLTAMENGWTLPIYTWPVYLLTTPARDPKQCGQGDWMWGNETADMQVRIMKPLQDRPRKDLPKNSWDFLPISQRISWNQHRQNESSPTRTRCRKSCSSHIATTHRVSRGLQEPCQNSHRADNESNLTRTKCREGYGENAAPSSTLIYPRPWTPTKRTPVDTLFGEKWIGNTLQLTKPAWLRSVELLFSLPKRPRLSRATWPLWAEPPDRSHPHGRARCRHSWGTMVEQHWGYEYGIIIGFHGNPISEHWDTSLPIWDINGTLGAHGLKYTQMNGFTNNQRDMNMGF